MAAPRDRGPPPPRTRFRVVSEEGGVYEIPFRPSLTVADVKCVLASASEVPASMISLSDCGFPMLRDEDTMERHRVSEYSEVRAKFYRRGD